MLNVNDPQFRPYGRVLKLDLEAFTEAISTVELPADGTMYEPSTPAFEALPLFQTLQTRSLASFPSSSAIAAAATASSMPSSIIARRRSTSRRRIST